MKQRIVRVFASCMLGVLLAVGLAPATLPQGAPAMTTQHDPGDGSGGGG